ncbi:MAG: hypothetical protein R3F55_03440 [Alphaproteobacteria bacterium]
MDGDGGLSIASSALLVGNPVNLNAVNDIALSRFLAAGSTVNVTSTGGGVSLVDASGTYSFGALSVTAANGISLGAMVSTTGAQTYDSPVTLTADTVLTSTGAGDISFNSTINGLFGLTVNTGGTTAFNDVIGGSAGGDRLGSLTTDAGGTSVFSINGTTQVSIQNDALFGDDVSISGNSQIWEFFGDTTFDGTVGGNVQMLMRAHNPLTLDAAVEFLAYQVVSGGLVTVNGGSVTTTGNAFPLDIQNNLVLGADTVFSSQGPLIFRGTVDGAFAMTLNSPRRTVFRGVVGGTTPLTSITTDAPGTTELEGGSITSSGNSLTINDATILGADTVITDAGAVTFNNTVDGAFALTIDAGGDVTFGGAVGGTDPLTSLTVGTDAAINVNGTITTDNGNVTFDADVMAIAATLNAGAGIVALRPRTAGETISLGTETAGSLARPTPNWTLSRRASCASAARVPAASISPPQSARRAPTPCR